MSRPAANSLPPFEGGALLPPLFSGDLQFLEWLQCWCESRHCVEYALRGFGRHFDVDVAAVFADFHLVAAELEFDYVLRFPLRFGVHDLTLLHSASSAFACASAVCWRLSVLVRRSTVLTILFLTALSSRCCVSSQVAWRLSTRFCADC